MVDQLSTRSRKECVLRANIVLAESWHNHVHEFIIFRSLCLSRFMKAMAMMTCRWRLQVPPARALAVIRCGEMLLPSKAEKHLDMLDAMVMAPFMGTSCFITDLYRFKIS